MRDPSITDEAIRKWLRGCILNVVVNALRAEGMIGVIEINKRTMAGHLWVKFKVPYDAPQKTPAYQFFLRTESRDQEQQVESIVQEMIDQAEVRPEIKAGLERLIPTTPLDELARVVGS
jgi:hypothetical protein